MAYDKYGLDFDHLVACIKKGQGAPALIGLIYGCDVGWLAAMYEKHPSLAQLAKSLNDTGWEPKPDKERVYTRYLLYLCDVYKGNMAKMAAHIECPRKALEDELQYHPTVLQQIESYRKAKVDNAEDRVDAMLNDPAHKKHAEIVQWVLEQLGEDRGYNKRSGKQVSASDDTLSLIHAMIAEKGKT